MPGQETDSRPLSAAQQGVWYAQRLDPASPVFNQGGWVELIGPVDVPLLAEAVSRLVAEDDTTRLRFTEVDGVPAQYLAPGEPYRPDVADLRDTPDPDAAADALIGADLAEVPDLERGPLFRHLLLRLGDERLRWYYRAHHLMQDGFSGHLLQRRLGEIYTAALTGAEAGAPLGPVSSLLDAQDSYGASPARAKDRAFWTRAMADAECPPARAGRPELRIAREVAHLDAEQRSALVEFAARAGVSWQQVLITAAVVQQHRRSGARDVLLSLPVTGRMTPAARRVPGMSANVLPLRVAVDPEATCEELASRVASAVLRVQWHQRYDAAELIRDLGWPADGRRQFGPVVNVLAGEAPPTFGGVPGTAHLLSTGGTAEDLGITVTDGPDGGLRLDFTVDAAYADAVPLTSHRRSFLRVLAALTGGPNVRVGEVDVLDGVERGLVVEAWNDTVVPIGEETLNTLFEHQARIRPDRTAVIHEDQHTTYRELNEAANRLAHHLTTCAGIRRGDLIGVLHDRSTTFATTLIALTKTGAAYTVLDPDFPDTRLNTVLARNHITTVITDTTHTHRITTAPHLIHTDTGHPACGTTHPDTDPDPGLTPHDTACVMFTSGSTGEPKGVLSSHRNLTSTLTAQTYARFGPTETTLQCSPVSWDAFSLEFWGALLHGGTTVLQTGQRPEPTLINTLTKQHRVTQLQLSSSLFNYLTDEHPDTFTTTHTAYTGGEPASPTHTHRLHQHHPHLTITNGYGPAESMGFTTTHTLTPTTTPPTTIPIGTPLTNKHAYILDTHLNPTPIGTTGEIYLAGHGLAHGYLGQPTTTATRFIPNPYGPPGTRLYRTGDLAHWTPHGTIHYTGRTDTQTKIRGFRIEPAEIEAVLAADAAVAQVAVMVREDRAGQKRLVAYVVPHPGSAAEERALREVCARALPEHMVPARVVSLDAMPLTANGKLDRAALPEPTTAATEGRAPRTELETTLTALFTTTLDAAHPLTIDDNFFDHGGHSLLAARLTNHIHTHTGTHLTIRDIFLNPTPATLAHHLTHTTPQRQDTPAAEAGPAGAGGLRRPERPERLPLSFAQQRLWLLASMEELGTAYNVPMTARLAEAPDPDVLRAAVADVVARHEPLRTVYATHEGEPVQRVLPAGEREPFVEHRRTTAEKLPEELADAARHAFDLAAEPQLRVTLFDTGDGGATLLVLLHHIATDGQSLGPLFDDLATAYAARAAGVQPEWPPLPTAYADHALRQRAELGDPADPRSALGRHLAYWRQALAELPEELPLPLDRPRPSVAGNRGATVPVAFGPELYARIDRLARAERSTPFMVVQAAVATALHRLGAGDDIPLGVPVAGRSSGDLAPLVGFFVNTLVLRTDTGGNPSFRELLRRVRAADLDAFAHQEAPFDQVLEAVSPRRSPARHPLFQVCLALEGGPEPTVRLAGSEPAPASVVDTGGAKFDLEFLLRGEPASGLTGALLYNRDLFDAATAERMVAVVGRVLDHALREPDTTLSSIEVLDGVERGLVVEAWNDTVVPIGEETLNTLFEHQARTRPDRTAVIHEDQHTTYRQLNENANRLAHHLTTCAGIRRGDLIGVLHDRSTTFATTLIALTKTGAAYTVLDPDFPDTRLNTVLARNHITTVITDTTHTHRITTAPHLIHTDTGHPACGTTHPDTDPDPGLTPHDTACVMFTSGSTGEPKGVLSSHRNLTSTLTAQTYARFGPTETTLQCSPVSWDAFSLEFWGALLHGGTTVLQTGQRPEPTLINTLTKQHRVTQLQLSSSLFNYLTDEHPDTFTTTHTAYTGGEPASPTHTHRLHQHHPHLTITNGYGPAESMGFTTTHTLTPTTTPPTTIPIGTPLTNKHAYILDTHLNPTPIGTTGEIYLAGHGLAHGYLGQPTTTATRFIPNPYGPPGTRLYRTGDLAHWTPHGTIHYTGRTDTQTKIRGFRIEPAEVETALLEHAEIAQAAVHTHRDRHGTARLAAWVVPAPDRAPTPQDLRGWARTRLPEHMVPSYVTVLDRLPLTANGKLDRAALPEPTTAATEGRAPRTELETTLTALFTTTLDAAHPLTIDDNFFDHGGHSLLAARLTNHIHTHTGTHLTIRDIFLNPTPATLAHHLTHTTPQSSGAPAGDAGTARGPAAGARRRRPTLTRRTEDGALLTTAAAPLAGPTPTPTATAPAARRDERSPL